MRNHCYIIILFICLLIFYSLLIYPDIRNNPPLPPDVYRDIAHTQNILNGNSPLSDPAIKGEYLWYPPLEPLLMAGLAVITGLDLFTLYSYSLLYINFFIPLLFFICIAQITDKRTAFFAAFFIPIMPWLNTHLFKGAMPSVHGFAFLLGTAILFLRFEKKGFTRPRAAVTGIVIGLCLLFHSLSGLIVYTSITAVLFLNKCLFKKPYRISHILLITCLPIIIFSPYFVPNIVRPKLNPAPLTYFSSALYDPGFILYFSHKTLFVIFILFALYGIVKMRSRIRETPVLFLYSTLIITMAGQLHGYIADNARTGGFFRFAQPLPSLIPHEFQWFFQLFLLGFIAWGFLDISFRLTEKKHSIMTYLLIFLLVLPGYITLVQNNKPVTTEKGTYTKPASIRWIAKNTGKNDVFVVANHYYLYYEFQPWTARKILYSDHGYMNFNVNTKKRAEAKKRFLHIAGITEIFVLAEIYDIDYCLISRELDISDKRLEFFIQNFPVIYMDEWFVILQIKQ